MRSLGLGGVLAATITPLDREGRFEPNAFERLLARCYHGGCHGVYVNGFTGEGHQQPVEQRKIVAEAAIALSPPGKQVIIHIGASNTRDAIELARHAANKGATAVSSLPPPGPFEVEEFVSYYRAVAEAVEAPFLVYYFPSLCPALTSLDTLIRLVELPNVAGLKFTDFDLYKLSELRARCECVFNGRDEILAAGLLMGADGGIGTFYNLVPDLFTGVYEAARRGDWERATEIQKAINRLITVVLRFPVLGATKAILRWCGIDCGAPIQPRAALTADQERALAAQLEDFGPLAQSICARPAVS